MRFEDASKKISGGKIEGVLNCTGNLRDRSFFCVYLSADAFAPRLHVTSRKISGKK
jgi:hypothetical protein